MFFTLSKIIDFLLLPITWLIALSLITIISKNKKIKKIAGITVLCLLILGSNSYIVNKLFSFYELPQTSLEKKAYFPIAVVLGGGMIRSNQEDSSRINVGESADRFMQAVLLYKQGIIGRILITGGNTSIGNLKIDESNETAQVKRLLIDLGIPKDSILTEIEAKNTHENALYTKRILDAIQIKSPVLLITSAFHMRRAAACFQKEQINFIPYVVDSKKKDTPLSILECITPSERELAKFSYLIREICGYAIYQIMGYA